MKVISVILMSPFIVIGFLYAWVQSAIYAGIYLFKNTGL